MDLQPGQIVHVRSRKYLVEGVVPPPEPADSPLVRLSCLEDDALGERLEVLWDTEIDAKVIDGANWQAIASRGFDEPRLFSAYLNTLRWNCVTSTNARLFQAPYRAGIEVKAFQLEPLRKALLMPRVNLFIADSVGLGKTIEAGLILREMLMRQKVRRTVICCPPSVVRQWKDEMEQRFGLTFMIYDRDYVTAKRQERGYSVNPWTTHSRFIVSQALIRNETYAGALRDWLGEFQGGSMFILDEAHNAAPAGATKYAIDSKLTQSVRDLTPLFEHKLFLSATPHNGHSNSFSALLEMLDPQKFCRGVPVHRASRDAVMIRRLKHDLREIGEEFPERKVIRIDIEGLPEDAPELVLSHLLQRYRRAREARLEAATKSQRASALLVVISLQKRLLSSLEAFARTLDVHRRWMQRQGEDDGASPAPGLRPETLSLLRAAPGSDDERAELPEEEVTTEDDAQMEAATAASGGPAEAMGPELALLDEMAGIANQARYEADSRVRHLIAWVKEHLCPDLGTRDARWNDRRVLIFTEYTDTKRYLVQLLQAAIADSDLAQDRIMTFHGGIGEERREVIKAAFNADPTRPATRCASWWRPMLAGRASISRTTAPTCSTSTSRGTRAGWSSATVASTASFNGRPRSAATTSWSTSELRTGCSTCWSRSPRSSTSSWAALPRWSPSGWTRCSRRASATSRWTTSSTRSTGSTARLRTVRRAWSCRRTSRRCASGRPRSPPRWSAWSRCSKNPATGSGSTTATSVTPCPPRWRFWGPSP
jgi:hypothetical protein